MATKEDFIGTWNLLVCEHRLENGTVIFPLGKSARGLLVYTAEGYMSGTLMDPNRPRFGSQDLFGGSLEEKAAAAAGFVHYSGKFQVEEKRVIHFVELSLFPNWIGSKQQRFYRFENPNRLDLSTNAFISDGVKQTAHLIWERLPNGASQPS